MNQLDVYYRALSDYRQQTLADHNCTSLRTAIATTDAEQDKIVITRSLCTIDNDWVDAIEAGIVHIEKAIKEERQFIRSNGEVIPIEKVKHVSRDSVEHLAKHSNLITQFEEGEDLTPEKLYTVERLSDYAVYENRFLYMLLCYLRDFITIRYNEIMEHSNKYEAEIAFDKKIVCGKHKMAYTLTMHDVKRDDPYLKETNPAKDIIDRIHLLLKSVIAFLGTPLMQEVSKVAMLKPPITKTNVLKMNNNFRGAMALYEFIMAYNKKGYTIEPLVSSLTPMQDTFADEMAEASSLVSFLTYEYALELNKPLKEAYLREEERRKLERIKQRSDRIETMKRKLANAEISAEEYAATLEDQLRELAGQAERAEKLSADLDAEREKTRALTREVEELNKKIESLYQEIEDMKQRHFEEIQRLKQQHEDEMHELIVAHEAEVADLKEQHAKEIADLIEKYTKEIADLNEKYTKEIADLNEKYTKEIADLNEKYTAEIAELNEKYTKEIADLNEKYTTEITELKEQHAQTLSDLDEKHAQKIAELNEAHALELQRQKDAADAAAEKHSAELASVQETAQEDIDRLQSTYDEKLANVQGRLETSEDELVRLRAEKEALLEDNRLSHARIKLLGGLTENYTDRERFGELEREYIVFTKLYKQQWEATKKEIKKQHLNVNNLKPQKEKKAGKETKKDSDSD